jgi:hypothetical protein
MVTASYRHFCTIPAGPGHALQASTYLPIVNTTVSGIGAFITAPCIFMAVLYHSLQEAG